MKLIIDVPEYIYKLCQGHGDIVYNYVGKGKPLPKGHGRILDEKDILDTENNDGGLYDLVDMPDYIAGVKSIIEADNTESEENHDINSRTPDNSGDNDTDGSTLEVE